MQQDGFGGGTNVTNNLIYNQCRESGGETRPLANGFVAGLGFHTDALLHFRSWRDEQLGSDCVHF